MAYDVASSISELLFEHNSVIIPDFGGFMLSHKSASIDHVQAIISPPAKVASFNNNLKINDGVLVNYIKSQNRCTLEQAQKIVEDYVFQLKQKIDKKEIIDFPRVGRLYKDYTEKMQFLPHDSNFNTDAFGLPELQYQPIHRSFERPKNVEKPVATGNYASGSEPPQSAPPVVSVTDDIPRLKEEEGNGTIPIGTQDEGFAWDKLLIPAIIVSIFVIAYGIYSLNSSSNGSAIVESNVVPKNIKEKLNKSPSLEDAKLAETSMEEEIPAEETDQYVSDDSNNSDDNNDEDYSTETDNTYSEPAERPGTKECVIIIGQYREKENAKNLARKVENRGYDVYEGYNEDENWDMIGVRFEYDTDAEKSLMLEQLRDEYDKSAWILKE